ncbi:MAG TPA: hypothetical protein VIK18_19320 [Pirellulales bacterium]
MSVEQYQVKLLGPAGAEAPGIFSFDRDAEYPNCKLLLVWSEEEIIGEGLDFFNATCRIRDQLEAMGWRPFCYGSSKNIYPSGMGRDMGRGLKAYKLELGRTPTDLVDIFEFGPDVEPSTVAEQRRFWEEWVRSIKQK